MEDLEQIIEKVHRVVSIKFEVKDLEKEKKELLKSLPKVARDALNVIK